LTVALSASRSRARLLTLRLRDPERALRDVRDDADRPERLVLTTAGIDRD
jgi:hypothetical protein